MAILQLIGDQRFKIDLVASQTSIPKVSQNRNIGKSNNLFFDNIRKIYQINIQDE